MQSLFFFTADNISSVVSFIVECEKRVVGEPLCRNNGEGGVALTSFYFSLTKLLLLIINHYEQSQVRNIISPTYPRL